MERSYNSDSVRALRKNVVHLYRSTRCRWCPTGQDEEKKSYSVCDKQACRSFEKKKHISSLYTETLPHKVNPKIRDP